MTKVVTGDPLLDDEVPPVAPSTPGNPGGGALPPGGATGRVLTKKSNADGDADWEAAGGDPSAAIATAVGTEATARAAADTTNATAISAETTRATAAEGTNATAITTEATARASAITTEATTRSTADTTNATAITTEATTRATADTTNATAITTEATRATAAEAALNMLTALMNAQLQAALSPQFILSGGTLTPTNAGVANTIEMAAGRGYTAPNAFTIAAASAQGGLTADATFDRWATIEIDTSGGYHVNLGTAAAVPVIPTTTTNRIAKGWVYIPKNATAVDAALTTINGNSKLFDNPSTRPPLPAVQQDVGTQSAAVNPTSLTSALTGTLPLLWAANEPQVGDVFQIRIWGKSILAVASTVELKPLAGSTAIFDYTTVSVTHTSGNEIRYWYQDIEIRFTTIGASGAANCFLKGELSPTTVAVFAPGVPFENMQGQHGVTFDTTTLTRFDLQVLIASSSASNQLQCFGCTIKKFPH